MLSGSNKTPVFRARIWSGFFTARPSPQLTAQQAYSFLQLQLAPGKLNNRPHRKRKNRQAANKTVDTGERAEKGKIRRKQLSEREEVKQKKGRAYSWWLYGTTQLEFV